MRLFSPRCCNGNLFCPRRLFGFLGGCPFRRGCLLCYKECRSCKNNANNCGCSRLYVKITSEYNCCGYIENSASLIVCDKEIKSNTVVAEKITKKCQSFEIKNY